MKRVWFAMLTGFACLSAQAQISYVTVRTPRSPAPPMMLIQSNQPPATVAQSAAPLVRVLPAPAPPRKPSLDKDELQRRVVTFQKQRAGEGFASAQHALGIRYLKGDGVEKDLSAARKWLALAAEGGDSEARRELDKLTAPPR